MINFWGPYRKLYLYPELDIYTLGPPFVKNTQQIPQDLKIQQVDLGEIVLAESI